MARAFFHILEEPNFTDEELEDVQELLWRGYVPPPYPRHDWYVYPPMPVLPPPARYRKPRPQRTVQQYSEFQCDECHRMFRSVSDEEEIDRAYHDTFGAAATEERRAVCEECYDMLMKELSG